MYWTGPDGFTATADNPVISNVGVKNNGTYTLIATSESGCTISESIVVDNIVPTPVMPTITAEAEVCADEIITLSVQETYLGINIDYVWTNGAGVIIGNTAIVDLDPLNGDAISPYRVMITVDGCTSPLSIPMEVEVGQLPVYRSNTDYF